MNPSLQLCNVTASIPYRQFHLYQISEHLVFYKDEVLKSSGTFLHILCCRLSPVGNLEKEIGHLNYKTIPPCYLNINFGGPIILTRSLSTEVQ